VECGLFIDLVFVLLHLYITIGLEIEKIREAFVIHQSVAALLLSYCESNLFLESIGGCENFHK